MRLAHFEAFAPVCPVCAGRGVQAPLVLVHRWEMRADTVVQGMLHCSAARCQHEYPILDGIPIIVPDLPRLLAERGVEMLVRCDLAPELESLFGDAIGPDSWFDVLRQTLSSYGWDGYADLDAGEPDGEPRPGAARRCLARLLELAGTPTGPPRHVVDLGCGAGRTSFDLAAHLPGALVLGVDVHLGLLRLAAGALDGVVSYPKRRIGLVYERRAFGVALDGADRVDFWAADALALPLPPGSADLAVALNLLDCVADPARLLSAIAEIVVPGGRLLLASPFDWSTRATPVGAWIGGHSQRAAHGGAAEAFLAALLTDGAHEASARGLSVIAREDGWPWHTRLHERSAVHYRTHLVAVKKE